MLRSLFVYVILSLWLYALPQVINEEIRRSGIPKKDISIYIKEAGKYGKVVASLNASKSRTPASVIKVLTTYASVLKLGFDYRWPTKFYTTGSVQNGVLQGDLLIQGFGDPTLNAEDLEQILSETRAKGIRQIRGDIVIDRSYFKVGSQDSSGFDENLYSAYNAMPDAMMFNERLVTVCVIPKEKRVHKKDVDEGYKVVDQLEHVNKPCRGKYSWPKVKIDKREVVPTVFLQGKISKRCGKRNICKVITKPYRSFYYALKDRLMQEGIAVRGGLKLRKIPREAKELFTHYSEPLEEIISETSKESNNLYARHLLLLLGEKLYGAPATVQKGRDAVKYILDEKGALGKGRLSIDNGSGLSRTAKMNAKQLAQMYDDAYERYGSRWMETLSIAGVDGTIKSRFRHTVVKKHAWMKTGTLRRVKNIGGYVQNRAGKFYTVVIIINSSKAKYRGAKLQDEIMKWLAKSRVKPSMVSSAPTASRTAQAKKTASEKLFRNVKTKALSTMKDGTKENAGHYYIQVGSFSSMPNNAYLAKISALGLRYRVHRTDNYRVLIGAYSDEKSAREALKKVRRDINGGAFIVKL
ncbi:D-alanyl-D-alanine carboxypeptidase/D-alanyl-D-alanine-endopeptidase [Sulfurovum sp. XGS-02]|uniref:D-alanyl-D-alanine carboxypeptidase/D-alanyl-D-alanine endopeptidase n=1 Tax=Sulfurovum sp. XGS-02 TaxID=2925411 RepID=UPI002063B2C7|nr:D-alanyl-D-alanine carboxypeptidase/D-alanyl-D-alanine-endopeptidase [Sulfurovum sp. XGS-02]UPT77859.1 D-alanyl-D-alanine carboxypeptidase/D-alanyl-D-alanine-endopeptidase [Sulfurovum sp. XGS-02]